MPAPKGFAWTQRKNGDVVISHHHKVATVLRGRKAQEFLGDVSSEESDDADQEMMARLTGNYKRGNERQARNHPRNRNPR